MNEFKTSFNPTFSILRFVFALFFVAISIFCISSMAGDFSTLTIKETVSLSLGSIGFGFISYTFFSDVFKEIKTVTIAADSIKVFNYSTFQERTIHKNEIQGFSTSVYPTKIWDFKQIIVYLETSEKIELRQFCYLNYKDIKLALEENQFIYFGFEPYKWRWLNSRYYKYEKTADNTAFKL